MAWSAGQTSVKRLFRTDFWRWDGMGCSRPVGHGLTGAKHGRFDTNEPARQIFSAVVFIADMIRSSRPARLPMVAHPAVCTYSVGRFLEAGQIFGGQPASQALGQARHGSAKSV